MIDLSRMGRNYQMSLSQHGENGQHDEFFGS